MWILKQSRSTEAIYEMPKFFLPFDRWVPESARWLLTKGKIKQAHRYLHKCAKINKRKEFAAKINFEVSQDLRVPGQRNRPVLTNLILLLP